MSSQRPQGQIIIDPQQLLDAFGLIAHIQPDQARVVSFQRRGKPRFYDLEILPYIECNCGRAAWHDTMKGPCKHVLSILMVSGYRDVTEAAEAMAQSQPVEVTNRLASLAQHLVRYMGASAGASTFDIWTSQLPPAVRSLSSLVAPVNAPVARDTPAMESSWGR